MPFDSIDNIRQLKSEKDSLDINEAHPRIIASILHDFYTACEKIFKRIADEFDGGLPKGESWHRDLLDSMELDIDDIRPALIDNNLKNKLDEYLRFRHLFRNIYGFELDRKKLTGLIEKFDETLSEFEKQVIKFNEFLDKLTKET